MTMIGTIFLYITGAIMIVLLLMSMIHSILDIWHVIDKESYEKWRNRKIAKFKSRL